MRRHITVNTIHLPSVSSHASFKRALSYQIQTLWLFVTLFFLVFGPRLFGNFALDTLTIACLLQVFFYAYRERGRILLPKRISFIMVLLIALTLYVAVITTVFGKGEFFYVAKMIRAVINFLAVVLFCQAVAHRFGADSFQVILRLVVLVAAFHSIIVVGQWFNPTWAKIIQGISGYSGSSEYRFSGLTWSFNATNIFNGFALFLLVASRFSIFKKHISIGMAILIAVAMSGMGRTSFFVALGIIVVMAVRMRYWALLCAGLSAFFAAYLYFGALQDLSGDNVRLLFLLDPINVILGEDGVYTRSFFDTWRSFFTLPTEVSGLLFGYGISGRDGYYVASDIGYILNIWGVGVLGSALGLVVHFYIAKAGLQAKMHKELIANAVPGLVVMILLLNLKEQEIFVRHVLSALAIAGWMASVNLLAERKVSV